MLRILTAGSVAAGTLGLAVATSAQPMTEQFPVTSGPVTITSCSLGQSGNSVGDNSLEIKYFQNVPRRHLVSVTFRIRYAGQEATVTDNGRFTYDATIDHKFNALAGTPWNGPTPGVCRVLSATFGDGRTVRPGDQGAAAGGPPPGAGGPPAQGAPGTMPPYATQQGAPPPPAPAAT